MFPSPYFYPQSLVSNLDPGAALYLYRGPSAPPPALQRPLVPRILLHGLQGASEPPPPPPPLPPMSGVLPRPAQQRWAGPCRYYFSLFLLLFFFFGFSFADPGSLGLVRINETKTERVLKKQTPKKTKTKTNCSAFKWWKLIHDEPRRTDLCDWDPRCLYGSFFSFSLCLWGQELYL